MLEVSQYYKAIAIKTPTKTSTKTDMKTSETE
jgi:hypothetical protein